MLRLVTSLIFATFATVAHAQTTEAEDPFAGQIVEGCHAQIPCQLDDRSYHLKLPDDWDGVTPMPVMLHFHGWMRQGTLIVKHGRISGATRKRGVLLLAPNGYGKTWDFWDSETFDVEFAEAVLEDAARKYPIDRNNIFVSGYSYGSAMAWRYVCENGNEVRALLAVAGSIQQNTDCPEAPGEVRHVHGTSDTVMDFPFGPDGSTDYPVWLWREKFECGEGQTAGEWSVTRHDTFTRRVWMDCQSGGPVTLDIHRRGHFIPRGWIATQLDQLLLEEPAIN